MNRSVFAIIALALTTAIVGCSEDAGDVESSSAAVESVRRDGTTADGGATDLAGLKANVQTLLTSHCGSCHIDRTPVAGGLNLVSFVESTVDVPSAQVPTMKRIAPKDRANSYLFHKLNGTHATVGGVGRQMPPAGPLSAEDIELVGSLIDALGADGGSSAP